MSFFFAEEVSTTSKTKSGRKLLTMDTLHKLECKACPLNDIKGLSNPKMEPTGSKRPVVYMLGEAPGKVEDRKGKQFVGDSGQLLRQRVPKKYKKKLRWNNCVRTRPPKNATPGVMELECCRPSIVRDIEKTKPKAIFGFGGVPLKWATEDDGIYKWRGRHLALKIGTHVCWFFPMLHPAGLLRKRKKNRRTGRPIKSDDEIVFERDLKRAFKLVGTLPDAVVSSPYSDPAAGPEGLVNPSGARRLDVYSGVKYVSGSRGDRDVEVVLEKLKIFAKLKYTSVDIETASRDRMRDRQTRPHSQGARVLSVAIAGKIRSELESFAFPINHREAGWSETQRVKIEKAFAKFLRTASGSKIAHNAVFEQEWCGYFYGLDTIRPGIWEDTMAQAYVLDERKGMLNLDVLVLLHFGFHFKRLIGVNRADLDREPLDAVLVYNALDSLFEYKLFFKQRKLLRKEKLQTVYELHRRRIPTVAITQIFGVLIDFDTVLAFDSKFQRQYKKISKWIDKSKTAARFKAKFGKKFNPASSKDVIDLFKEVLRRPEGEAPEDAKPGTPKYSVGDDVLGAIGTPFSKKIQTFRAIAGNKAKYVDPIHPETGKCVFPDGLIHPNIHTLFTDTGRTSSSFPNEQYWPKRDESYKDLRSEFVAPDDCWCVVIDFGQIQARIIEMAAKDKRYGKYLWDRHDIHGEWTERIAHAYPRRIGGKKFIKDKDVMKLFRNDVKNQWTFPLFFGASEWSVSKYLHIPVEDVIPLVEQFWEEYEGVKTWQVWLEDFYKKNGYVECLAGRRRREPISHNELINSPIQGTEADIVMDAFNRLSESAQEMDMWQFQARLEVHDELVFYIPKKTFDRDVEFIADYMLECEHFDFINVPLCIEIGRGPNWYEQEFVAELFADDYGKIDREACGF